MSTRNLRCRFSACGSLLRRFVAILLAISALALVPNVTRADFVGEPGLNESGLPRQAGLFAQETSLFGVFCERMGCGSSADEVPNAPVNDSPKDNDRDPPRPSALADVAESGCGSTSTPTTGAASAGSVGILNEGLTSMGVTCSGRIMSYVPLNLPSPVAERLLDPPRDVA